MACGCAHKARHSPRVWSTPDKPQVWSQVADILPTWDQRVGLGQPISVGLKGVATRAPSWPEWGWGPHWGLVLVLQTRKLAASNGTSSRACSDTHAGLPNPILVQKVWGRPENLRLYQGPR